MSLLVNAQHNSNADLFQMEVVEYSYELDSKKPRYHILALQNNTNKELTINLSTIVDDTNGGDKKNNQNLIVDLLSEDLTQSLNSISLRSKQLIKFKVKIVYHPNARLGSMNICTIIAKSSNNTDEKTLKINANIPNPKTKGH
ncbi:hypothetical protein [Algibacter sp. R77976]|uniref:hypothetical protein n=1 Tax=Algibacter sp. R77976 TaxID=3093873 RepID=UPI0037CBC6D1